MDSLETTASAGSKMYGSSDYPPIFDDEPPPLDDFDDEGDDDGFGAFSTFQSKPPLQSENWSSWPENDDSAMEKKDSANSFGDFNAFGGKSLNQSQPENTLKKLDACKTVPKIEPVNGNMQFDSTNGDDFGDFGAFGKAENKIIEPIPKSTNNKIIPPVTKISKDETSYSLDRVSKYDLSNRDNDVKFENENHFIDINSRLKKPEDESNLSHSKGLKNDVSVENDNGQATFSNLDDAKAQFFPDDNSKDGNGDNFPEYNNRNDTDKEENSKSNPFQIRNNNSGLVLQDSVEIHKDHGLIAKAGENIIVEDTSFSSEYPENNVGSQYEDSKSVSCLSNDDDDEFGNFSRLPPDDDDFGDFSNFSDDINKEENFAPVKDVKFESNSLANASNNHEEFGITDKTSFSQPYIVTNLQETDNSKEGLQRLHGKNKEFQINAPGSEKDDEIKKNSSFLDAVSDNGSINKLSNIQGNVIDTKIYGNPTTESLSTYNTQQNLNDKSNDLGKDGQNYFGNMEVSDFDEVRNETEDLSKKGISSSNDFGNFGKFSEVTKRISDPQPGDSARIDLDVVQNVNGLLADGASSEKDVDCASTNNKEIRSKEGEFYDSVVVKAKEQDPDQDMNPGKLSKMPDIVSSSEMSSDFGDFEAVSDTMKHGSLTYQVSYGKSLDFEENNGIQNQSEAVSNDDDNVRFLAFQDLNYKQDNKVTDGEKFDKGDQLRMFDSDLKSDDFDDFSSFQSNGNESLAQNDNFAAFNNVEPQEEDNQAGQSSLKSVETFKKTNEDEFTGFHNTEPSKKTIASFQSNEPQNEKMMSGLSDEESEDDFASFQSIKTSIDAVKPASTTLVSGESHHAENKGTFAAFQDDKISEEFIEDDFASFQSIESSTNGVSQELSSFKNCESSSNENKDTFAAFQVGKMSEESAEDDFASFQSIESSTKEVSQELSSFKNCESSSNENKDTFAAFQVGKMSEESAEDDFASFQSIESSTKEVSQELSSFKSFEISNNDKETFAAFRSNNSEIDANSSTSKSVESAQTGFPAFQNEGGKEKSTGFAAFQNNQPTQSSADDDWSAFPDDKNVGNVANTTIVSKQDRFGDFKQKASVPSAVEKSHKAKNLSSKLHVLLSPCFPNTNALTINRLPVDQSFLQNYLGQDNTNELQCIWSRLIGSEETDQTWNLSFKSSTNFKRMLFTMGLCYEHIAKKWKHSSHDTQSSLSPTSSVASFEVDSSSEPMAILVPEPVGKSSSLLKPTLLAQSQQKEVDLPKVSSVSSLKKGDSGSDTTSETASLDLEFFSGGQQSVTTSQSNKDLASLNEFDLLSLGTDSAPAIPSDATASKRGLDSQALSSRTEKVSANLPFNLDALSKAASKPSLSEDAKNFLADLDDLKFMNSSVLMFPTKLSGE